MILNRIAHAMKRQDWFLVVVEVLVVVVGLFLGLQIDDWNKARLDRQDEQLFLQRLHEEMVNSVGVRSFINKRRLELGMKIPQVIDTVFNEASREKLTEEECTALSLSYMKTAYVVELPSFNTLMSTGRINIIQDEALKTSLVNFDQLRQNLSNFAKLPGVYFPGKYPQLFQTRPTIDEHKNYEGLSRCDLKKMRAHQGFLNDLVFNGDAYDAYISSGLKPMLNAIEPLHQLLDKNLGIKH